ncbi:maleylpyruvate isomerase family mycothiol-dependent enzyme [Saccharomonospora sp. NB11]|uniref:maleylpyruvate isomerase family mycothiol-dependent enzyme n=1 Tax=Saccharomonospora sp. NB11 TaxID=1642298 RepID=UPI0018D0D294|nr:maleylpyruvate isomerase family mycothiol-dependent enzyme [Saccharomonospora sp. NB11]
MRSGSVIDHGRLLDAIGYEAELLVEVSRSGSPEAAVPTCPGWTLSEVVRHVGSVHRAASHWVLHGEAPRRWQRDPVPGQTVQGYLRDGAEGLRDVLAARTPTTSAATWWDDDPTAGFWYRRMAHETTMHRVDAERALGVESSEIAHDVALDGIDEALLLWFGHRLPMLGVTGTRTATVAVAAAGCRWLARMTPESTVVRRSSGAEPDEVDAVVSGEPEQVYLWLWGRQGPSAVSVAGDHDAVGQLWALLRLATR